MPSVTWAVFGWIDGEWHLLNLTRHDEIATEYEDLREDMPVEVIGLDDPSPVEEAEDEGVEDVPVKDNLL